MILKINLTSLFAILVATITLTLISFPVQAQVARTSFGFAWAENAGYLSGRAVNRTPGITNYENVFLRGYFWAENVGWICLGGAAPSKQSGYSNTSGTTYGVNILPNGDLSGFGWAENVGWINFSTSSKGAQRARLGKDGALHGFCWSENIGWINLDVPH